MQRKTSKRRLLIKRVIGYTLMTASVLALSTVLILVLLGYRFNKQEGQFLQGGLVQFISQPSGARVTVGNAVLGNRTRSKITLNPGSYVVKMELKDYTTWQKKVTVEPGKVLWLNSTHFVPVNPVTTQAVQLGPHPSVVARPGGKYIAAIKDSEVPTVSLVNIQGDTPKLETVALPTLNYHAARKHHFTLEKWSDDDQYLLVQHNFDTSSEMIVMNIDHPEKSRVIPTMKNVTIKTVLFDPSSNDRVLVLYSDGTLRRITISIGEQSNVPVKNVSQVSLSSAQTLLYSTKSIKGSTTVGYLTLSTMTPRTIATLASSKPVSVAGGQYFDAFYVATSTGNMMTISKLVNLPASDSLEPLQSTMLSTLQLDNPVTFISFKNNNRFVVAQQAKKQLVYDLELATTSDVPIVGAKKPLTASLDWLDGYHFWDDSTNKMRQYEYDGTNQTAITDVAPGFPAVYSPNQTYLYTIGKTKDGFDLQQTRMILK